MVTTMPAMLRIARRPAKPGTTSAAAISSAMNTASMRVLANSALKCAGERNGATGAPMMQNTRVAPVIGSALSLVISLVIPR